MTVAKLIKYLKKLKCPNHAEVTFCVGGGSRWKEYDIESIGQFNIVPDVNVNLKEKK